jgi:hypothetical protein
MPTSHDGATGVDIMAVATGEEGATDRDRGIHLVGCGPRPRCSPVGKAEGRRKVEVKGK